MKRSKIVISLYLLLLLIAVLGSCSLLVKGPAFRTDIFSLLPPIQRDPVLERVLRAQAEGLAKKIVIVAQGPTDSIAEREAIRVASLMGASDLFSSVQSRISAADLTPLSDFFLQHPFQLAGVGIAESSLADPGRLTSGTLQRAFASDSIQWLQNANRDPLLLLPTYLKALTSHGGKYSLRNGFIHVDTESLRNVLISADLRESPYSRTTQERIASFLATLAPSPPSRILTSGVVLFANESAARTQREVTIISTVTMCSVVAVLTFVFRSLYVVILIAASITTSFLGSLWATSLLVQGLYGHPLHLITLGFGSSLLGVAVDYALHFFIAHRSTRQTERRSPLSRIRAGLILGFVTTAIGFVGIALSPFPGLQELALFCVLGLTLTILTVCLVLPAVAGHPRVDVTLRELADISTVLLRPHALGLSSIALILLCVFGIPRLKVSDDIRTLHQPSATLVNSQREVAELTGMNNGGTFAIIRAPSEEAALQTEEGLRSRLDSLIKAGQLDSYRAFSSVVPSRRAQRATYQTLATSIGSARQSFMKLANDLHLSQEATERLLSLKEEPQEYALPSDCIATRACRMVEDLWLGSQSQQVATTVALHGFKGDSHSLSAGLSGTIDIVNHADAISNALHLYRLSATTITGLFYCAVFALLAFRYGIAHLWRVIVPPSLAALAALAALGLFGVPVNVFSMFALMVLLGVSVDYVIFFSEEREIQSSTHLSVFLSALTTIISFGALSLSSTSALQSFGIVLSVGVFFSALLSPLATRKLLEQS